MLFRWLIALVFSFGVAHAYAQTNPESESVPSLTSEAPLAVQAAITGLSNYRLSSGDVLTVRVLGEEDLSKEKVRLTDAGTVSLPAIGEVRAFGLTIGELERTVEDALRGRYLVNPKVSVSIDEYRPFYINGMVEKPGGYPYQPGLTIRKAASLAGGFRERASLTKIYIIRERDVTQRSQRVDLNTLVFPGDIVTVDESFF
ncbi:polysaccharide biosynthesis/export family protein [Azonexus hydrophilus]|uniref:Polysaccharide biosynthesis/export family protein n=1 Tax=Azonexus hydrophilus TaxID=418702 RepID=A0ABZ2XNX7_9RHOO|nr:polysaccharide biosynthesis/export family protein [Azonexus hydrophilus]